MLDEGVIQRSTSPWSSPTVLVRKADGSVLFCIDYRKLNAVSVQDCYPLPRMEDCLESLGGAKYFSTMDLASGYWQIPVKEEDRPKTAFVTKLGQYEFTVMPFGLAGAPRTFERCMEMILQGLQWQTCLIYLDDIIIYAGNFNEHLRRLEEVVQRIEIAGLKLKPSKCELFQKQVKFLGHIVSADGVATDPDKLQALTKWPVPEGKRDVRSFLGFC